MKYLLNGVRRLIFSIVAGTLLLLSLHHSVYAEGTKQVRPDSTVSAAALIIDWDDPNFTRFCMLGCPANYRLNIHIKNIGEKILFGLKTPYNSPTPILYNLRRPDGTIAINGTLAMSGAGYIKYYRQATIGPFPTTGGYTPISVTSNMVGDWYFEITQVGNDALLNDNCARFDLWDFQVVNGVATPQPSDTLNGRVWSQSWQLYSRLPVNWPPNEVFSGSFFVYTDDGIVTKLVCNGMYMGEGTFFCNPIGCTNTGNFTIDRQSKNTNTFVGFPGIAGYKVFLNNPDITVYPNGVFGILNSVTYHDDPNAPCSWNKFFELNVNKGGQVVIKIDVPYGDPSYDVFVIANVVPGNNTIPWNGLDGHGGLVPNGTVLTITVDYLNGLTNLPLWDFEANPNGYKVYPVRPVGPGLQAPLFYWDDSQLTGTSNCSNPPTTVNLTGCNPSGSVCHDWPTTICHDKMINTWWYSGSTSSALAITFNSQPIPVITGPAPVCTNTAGCVYITEAGNSSYSWAVSAGGTISGGGGINNNSVTVTWGAAGAPTVSVSYTGTNGCPSLLTTKNVLVSSSLTASVSIAASSNPVCPGTSVTYTATPTNGGTVPSYQWKVNGVNQGTNSSTFTYTPVNSDKITCVLTSSLTCSTGPATSNMITMVVSNPLPVSVTIAASATTVCAGDPVTFTATPVNGGPTPSYQWKVNGVNSGTNSPVFIFYPSDNDQITCVLTSSLWCVTGSGTSNTITINVNTRPIPTLTGPTPICAGSTGNVYTTQGSKSNYVWVVSAGGSITSGGTTSSSSVTVTWTTAGPQTISVNYMNSSGCYAITPTVLNVTVNPRPLPTIIGPASACNPSAGNIYTTEAGMTSYIWGVSAGGTVTSGGTATSNTVTVTWNIAGPQTVSVRYTNTFGCTTAAAIVYSVNVNNNLPVSVSIAASANPVCAGSAVILTATPINGGSAPSYQWKVNGVNQGTNSPTYTYTPVNGDIIICVLTSDLTCVTGNPATSNTITMTVNPLLPVSVSIAASANPVCAGTAVTFTVTPTNGGSTPSYQWKVNGVNQGTNSPTYTFNPINGQTIACVLTSNDTCATGNPATSNMITMTVNPMLPVSVSIAASSNPVCAGIAVTFTATPTNGGSAPSYQWKVNGVNQGTNSPTYTYTPANGDIVTCVLTSNLTCVTGNPATSNTITMTVNPLPVPTITGPTPVCVNSTGNVYTTQAGMTNYIWSVSAGGTITAGGGTTENNVTVTWTTAGAHTVSVNYTNSNGCTATSSTTVVIRAAFLAPVASSNQTICYNTVPAAISATAATGGSGPYTYQWQSSPDGLTWNNITGATALTYPPLALTSTTRYRILVTDAGIPSCGTAVSSNIVVITVQAEVIPGVVAANQTICSGGDPAAFTITTPASGSGTLSYQWQSSTTACTGPWTDIPTATSAIYDPPPGLTQTTYYHRVVISTLNGVPCTATSNCITVTIQTQITSSTIAADQTLCNGGDPAILTGDAGSGGSGTITYRWESFTGGGPWTTIAGATSISYDPLTLIATTQYRRFRVSTLGGNVCESSASNIVTITIQPIVNPGNIGADQMVCEGGDPSLLTSITDPSGGNPPLAIQWQTSITSAVAGFTDIAGATSLTYDPGPFAVDTWFRRMITSTQNGVLCQAFSNAIKVTVNNISSAGTIAEDQVLCLGQNPVPFTSVAPAAGDGTITYQWQSSTTNATTGFSDIPGATGLTYAPLTPPVNTWYRRMSVSTLNGFVCSGSSNSVAILIGSFNPGTITPFDNDTIFCVGQDPGIISGTPFNLPPPPPNIQFQEYRWQSNTTGNPADFTDIIPLVNTQNYDPPVITISTWYRRVVYVKIQGKDCSAPSNIVDLRVYPVPTLTVSTPVVTCQGSTYTITATAGNTGGSTPIFTLDYVSGTYITPPPVQTNTTGIFTITPPTPPEFPPVGQQHFNVTITNGDPGACTTTKPVTVEIYDVPDITLTPSCAATSGNGFITMTGVVTYPAGSFVQYRIMLNPAGSWSPWQTNPIFSNLSIGSYTVEARNNPATSCTALLTGDVVALTVVTTDYSVCQNGTVPTGEGLVGVSYCITWGNVQSHVGTVCTDPSHTYIMSSQQYHYSPGPLVQYAIYATIWAPFGVMTIKDCPNVPGRTYSIYKYPFNPQNPSVNFVEKILNTCPGGPGATVDSLDINSDYQIILNSPNSYTIVCTNIAFVTGQQIQTAVDIQPVKWYLTSTSTEAIYTGSPFNPLTTPGSGVSGTACPGTYTFYAGCGTGLCREPAHFIINPIPIVVAINDTICSGSTTNVLLQSTESCNNTYIDPSKVTYQWYATPNSNVTGEESCTQANPCSGPVIALQLTSTTTSICPVVTFHVRSKVGTCWGSWYTVNVLIINSNSITPPVAPANVVYTCLSQVPPPPILTAGHACLGTLTAQGVDSNNGGAGCPGNPLIITRTWVFHDKCINIIVTQTIRVNDSIAPTFTRPIDITLYTDAFCSYSANPIYTGDVSDEADNCTASGLNAVYSDVIANGPCQGSKIITRTWSLTDGCNNTTIKVQTITVIDAIPPTFTRPPDIAINSDVNCASNVSVNITGDVTNEHDNCSTGLQATYIDAVNNSNPCNIIITRTWHLVDYCGNAAIDQVQTIIVHDILPPTFTRPPNITIYTDANCNYNASVSVTGDVTDEHDNCSTGLEATFSDVVSSGSCEGYRIITRTWHLMDYCGNAAANQIQVITVNDNIPPTFTRPPDITIYADFNCNYNASLAVTGDVTNVHDNCSTGIQATYVDAVTNGSCQGKKIITRTWSLVDNCGNAASNQVQTITVNDITPPVITSCPSIINTLADPGKPYATLSIPAPVYSDNCTATGNISVTWTMTAPTAGSGSGIIPVPFQFNIGTTTVTYNITDACGNFSTCSFDVIINPNYLPDITCPADISQTSDPGLCSAALNPGFPTLVSGTAPISYTWVMTGATTGSGSGAIIPNPHIFNVGVTTITWTATNSGGFDTCTQTITVMDNQPPTFTTPLPLSFCVEKIDTALYWDPTMDIAPDRPEYYLFKAGDTVLDLNPATFTDNCPLNCVAEIRWRISFFNGTFLPLLPSLYNTGQPSDYLSDIQLPGSVTGDVVHTITYQIVDCNGNVSLPTTINITIKPRPNIIKQ